MGGEIRREKSLKKDFKGLKAARTGT